MTARTNVTGEYTRADWQRLSYPIAWSGTVSAEDRAAQETDLAELLDEMGGIFDHPDVHVKSVTVQDGEIIGYTGYTDEEWEA